MRFNEFSVPKTQLTEAARIMHAEDLIFFEGSNGALRAIHNLAEICKDKSHKTLSIKWDGKPALIVGRDKSGTFILTDKAGFTAKGYDGLYKSAQQFVTQKASKGTDKDYLRKIAQIWPMMENMVPKAYRGFVMGDVMWFPGEIKETTKRYIFTPNTVTYEVDKKSSLGQCIKQGQMGFAVHTFFHDPGIEGAPLKDTAGLNINGPVCVLGPEIRNEAPLQHDKAKIHQVSEYVRNHKQVIDKFLDPMTLSAAKMTGLPNILYNYVNQRTAKRDLTHLAEGFPLWVQSNPKLTKPMVAKILQYCKDNHAGLEAIFNVFDAITYLKLDILNQLDQFEGQVIAHIKGDRGGEGYVSGDEGGPIKLVNRLGFSATHFGAE